MEPLRIEVRFPKVQRVSIPLLRERYNIAECDIEEIKKFWILDLVTGYYCKPGGDYDSNK